MRAWLIVHKFGQSLLLADGDLPIASLSADKSGANLSLADPKGTPRALLGASKDKSGLCLNDENGGVRALLRADKNGQGLGLADENGKVIWGTP